MSIKQHLSALMFYVCVLFGGVAIAVTLIIEYKNANLLINQNKALMHSTVLKTISVNITTERGSLPIKLSDIENNWQQLDASFSVIENNQEVYPYRFKGNNSTQPSALWEIYEQTALSGVKKSLSVGKTPLSEDTNAPINKTSPANKQNTQVTPSFERLKALQNIRLGMANPNNKEALSQAIEDYFVHLENYRLSPLEELISGITFLNISTESRWNDDLIRLVLITGNMQYEPLVVWLFKHNDQFSRADTQRATQTILQIIEPTKIEQTWLLANIKALWEKSVVLPRASVQHFDIVNSQWIVLKTKDKVALAVPFSLEQELTIAKTQLTKLSVLDESDTIALRSDSALSAITPLADAPIKVSRDAWKSETQRQKMFFALKVGLLCALVISLLMVTWMLSQKHKRKMAYIRLRENFINLVSHELKTPLASIRIMVETLHKRNQRNMSIKDYPNKIVYEVDRLWLMVDNLLSLHQIKSGELSLKCETIYLHKMLTLSVQKFNQGNPNTLIFKNSVNTNKVIYADPLLFELVLMNLFSNAIKYCDACEAKICASFDVDKSIIYIKDNGSGIEDDAKGKIFEDFYRQAKHVAKPGTGIGLSLCKQIIDLHGGRIWVDESTANGTTWSIQIAQR